MAFAMVPEQVLALDLTASDLRVYIALRLLERKGAVKDKSIKDIAERAEVPLRTAERSIQRLADAGAIRIKAVFVEGQRRRSRYTFCHTGRETDIGTATSGGWHRHSRRGGTATGDGNGTATGTGMGTATSGGAIPTDRVQTTARQKTRRAGEVLKEGDIGVFPDGVPWEVICPDRVLMVEVDGSAIYDLTEGRIPDALLSQHRLS